MQGDPRSQRPARLRSTLQARRARPSSLEGEPEDRTGPIGGTPEGPPVRLQLEGGTAEGSDEMS